MININADVINLWEWSYIDKDDPNEKTNIQRLTSGELKRIRTNKKSNIIVSNLLFMIVLLFFPLLRNYLISGLTILTAFFKKRSNLVREKKNLTKLGDISTSQG